MTRNDNVPKHTTLVSYLSQTLSIIVIDGNNEHTIDSTVVYHDVLWNRSSEHLTHFIILQPNRIHHEEKRILLAHIHVPIHSIIDRIGILIRKEGVI